MVQSDHDVHCSGHDVHVVGGCGHDVPVHVYVLRHAHVRRHVFVCMLMFVSQLNSAPVRFVYVCQC